MSKAPFILIWMFIYSLGSLVSSGLVLLLARGQVLWKSWEFPVAFVPFIVWTVLAFAVDANKTLSNVVVEPFVCGLLSGIQFAVRWVVAKITGHDFPQVAFAGALVSALLTVAVFYLVPALPE